MKGKNQYVISYDIVCDKRRRRVSNVLEDYGFRMQKSVFECELDSKSLNGLMKKLSDIIEKEEDSILFYMLCNACMKKNKFLGIEPIRVKSEYEIV